MDILESKTHYTNKYLERITAFEEKSVAGYKMQVKQQIGGPYLVMLVLIVTLATVFSAAGAFVLLPLIYLPEAIRNYAYLGLGTIVIGIIACISAAKRTKKFIALNNGEVGHKRKPFWNKVSFHIIFSLALAAGLLFGFYYGYKYVFELPAEYTLAEQINELCGSFGMVFATMVMPFFYFLSAKITLRRMQRKNTCPCCGRIDTVRFENLSSFGKSKTGNFTKDVYERRHVADKITTTTTYYSDGSKTTSSSSSPIYANVYDHTDLYETGTQMNIWITFCTNCSYYEENLTKNKYTEKKGRL